MIQHHVIDYETKDKVFLFFIVVIATEIHAFKQYHTFYYKEEKIAYIRVVCHNKQQQ
jgi:hypothetical protein